MQDFSGARRRARYAVAAFGAALSTALAISPATEAAFTSQRCLAPNFLTGRGATFAAAAHTRWETYFETTFCSAAGDWPEVTYEAQGSGAGRRAMGERTGSNADGNQSRNQGLRFGMSDEPPSPTAQAQMNAGTDVSGDEGLIHVVPAAAGAVVPNVNFPNNCDRELLPDSAEADPASANAPPFVDRVRFTRTQLDEIWAGDSAADNWTEVFPTLAPDSDCNVSITRVVRFDDSGTSFALKDYFDRLNPARGWRTTYVTPDTRNWPDGPGVGDRDDCDDLPNGIPEPSDPDGPRGDNLTSGCTAGNLALVGKLETVDGSVGYSDIATAHIFDLRILQSSTPAGRDDDVFWMQAPGPGNVFMEPTSDPNGYLTSGQRGANCDPVMFSNVPSSTTGDWSQVSGVDSPQGYPICTLTYGLVFDDYLPPYSLQGCAYTCEEEQARGVNDYWTAILSDGGQATLPPEDYSKLPQSILEIARLGMTAVCFDKAGTGPCPGPTDYPRPGSATPLRVPLVIAYNECTSPNSTHVPPINGQSCTPPVRSSTELTAGTGGLGAPFAKYRVVAGNPATTADEAEVHVNAFINDVRRASDGLDYTGQVILTSQIRLTDKRSDELDTLSGTVRDTELSIPITCVATPGQGGSTCSVTSTMDALVPNFAREGERAIVSMLAVTVEDAGPNGTIGLDCPYVCGDGDEDVYLTQGLFAP